MVTIRAIHSTVNAHAVWGRRTIIHVSEKKGKRVLSLKERKMCRF